MRLLLVNSPVTRCHCHCVPALKQVIALTVVVQTGNKSGLVGVWEEEGPCQALALRLVIINKLTDSVCFPSPACLVLVCPKHVLLEQHLLQPGRPNEPAGGIFLPI